MEFVRLLLSMMLPFAMLRVSVLFMMLELSIMLPFMAEDNAVELLIELPVMAVRLSWLSVTFDLTAVELSIVAPIACIAYADMLWFVLFSTKLALMMLYSTVELIIVLLSIMLWFTIDVASTDALVRPDSDMALLFDADEPVMLLRYAVLFSTVLFAITPWYIELFPIWLAVTVDWLMTL